MTIFKIIFPTLLFLLSTNTFAGFYKSNYDQRGSVIASVEISENGIYNLIVSVQFLNRPYDKKEYDSDEYQELINRLNIEWRDIALNIILESNNYKISDLYTLKSRISEEIDKQIKKAKKKHQIKENTEVVYSITNFYLLELIDD